MTKDLDFAALLCSRLCHDLISPVSAVSNGVEILDDENDPLIREEVLGLVKKSADQTASMVQFYRLCFGAGGGLGSDIELKTVFESVGQFLACKKINLSWQADIETLQKDQVKILSNLLLIAGEGLIRGGEIGVSIKSSALLEIEIQMTGTTLILYPKTIEMMESGVLMEPLEPKTAPMAIILKLLNNVQGKVSIEGLTKESACLKVGWKI